MFRLVYPGTDFEFGPVDVESVEIGGVSYRVDDTPLPRRDGIAFGRDFADPGDIVLTVSVSGESQVWGDEEIRHDVYRKATVFSEAWDARVLREQPRLIAELVSGELGMFEGRPRGVQWDYANYAVGFLRGRARFVRASTAVYAVDPDTGESPWHEQAVGLVPAQLGGLVAPLVAPLTTARASTRARPFTVGGDADVWPVITVTGPLQSGGQVELVNRWSLRLNQALAYDDVVVIDTRPGRRLMTVNGRPGNVLAPSGARLSQAFMPPGLQEIALRGASVEGTASATIRWREQKAG